MSKGTERILNVSETIFSVVRHYGTAIIQGREYHYDADTDSLIRQDVWDKHLAEDKEARKKWEDSEREKWKKIQHPLDGF